MLPSEKLVKALQAYMQRRGYERSEQTDLARTSGVSQPTLSRLLSPSPLPTVSFDTWNSLHKKFPHEIPSPAVAGDNVEFIPPANAELITVVNSFKAQKLALEINSNLLELENRSPSAFNDANKYVKFLLSQTSKESKKKVTRAI